MMFYAKLSLNSYPKMDKIADIAKSVKATSAEATGSSKFQPLPDDFEPTEFSVICARGKRAYESPGNTWFRALVEQHSLQYSNASNKMEKSIVVSTIVDTVRKASPQGAFIRKVNGRWQEVSEGIARERVGQTFRDIIDSKYRSSTHAKKRRRAKRQAAQSTLMGTRRGSAGSESAQSTATSSIASEARRSSTASGDESLQSTVAEAKKESAANADDDNIPPQWLTQDVLSTSIFSDQHIEPARLEFSGGLNELDNPGFNQSGTFMANNMNAAGPEKSKMAPLGLGMSDNSMIDEATKAEEGSFSQQRWPLDPPGHFIARAIAPAASSDSGFSGLDSLTRNATVMAASGYAVRASAHSSTQAHDASAFMGGSRLDCLANAIDMFEQHPLISNTSTSTGANLNQPREQNNNLNNINMAMFGGFNNSEIQNNNSNFMPLLRGTSYHNNALEHVPAPAPERHDDMNDSDPLPLRDDVNPSDCSTSNRYRKWFGEDDA